MPTMGVARNYVDVPAPEVARGGVLAVARVIDSSDPHDMLGSQYLSDACITDTRRWDYYCQPGAAKVFEGGADVVEGDPFTLYQGVECNLQDYAEQQRRARARFDFAERLGVDRAIADVLEALTPVDLAGPFPIAQAIGTAEAYIADHYGGVGTLLIPIHLVPCGCTNGLIYRGLDGALVTCQGTMIGNIASGTPGASDTIYATGQITLLRGAIHEVFAPQQPFNDGTYAPPRALVERTYVPLIECLVARVEASCS